MKYFENKIALVTGGASGIGRATVKRFLEQGAKVAFTDVSEVTGQAQADEYKAQGYDVLFVASDATKEDDVASCIQKIVTHYGRLDVAVNNVGGLGKADKPFTLFHLSNLEGWLKTKELTEQTTYLFMKYEIEQMLKQGGGVIANTVSMSGLKTVITPSTAAYSAGKAALVHLIRYTALQYVKDNIRINGVAPGLVNTESIKKFSEEQKRALLEASQPNGRAVEPEEIADAFLFLCSDQAKSITGITIPVDGGFSIS